MKTTIFVCPFALFGNPGTMAGAELVADAIREMLDDNLDEDRPHRASVYSKHVSIEELPLSTPADYAEWQSRARSTVRSAMDNGHFLIWIGGNHLSVMPVYEELAGRNESMVLQLDAHLDVYHLRDCITELSHGNFLRHLEKLPTIINIGHRDLFLQRDEVAKYFRRAIPASQVIESEIDAIDFVRDEVRAANRIFVDIDCDVLDPAFFPAVVDALPFGLSPQQVLQVLGGVGSDKLSGIAISEFDPGRDMGERSLQLLIWLIEYVLLYKYESKSS